MWNPIEWYKKHQRMYVTSPYGMRTFRGVTRLHRGTDLGGISCGAQILAPCNGEIVAAHAYGWGARPTGMWPSWGNLLCLKPDRADAVILTAHHSRLLVKAGDGVEEGQPIATNGGTHHDHGNANHYACHIHLEVLNRDHSRPWSGSVWGDPERFFVDLTPSEPSEGFDVGDVVQNSTEYIVRIRKEPGTHNAIVGHVQPSQTKKIHKHESNGVKVGGYYWWYVGRGWVAEDFFKLYIPDPVPVEAPEVVEEEPETIRPQSLWELARCYFRYGIKFGKQ